MWRIEDASHLVPANPEYAVGWIAATIAAFITYLSNVAVQLLGVPLPVVMSAVAGACLARAYGEPLPFGKAVFRTMLWAAFASFVAPLLKVVLQSVLKKLVDPDIVLPNGALAGIAGILASAPLWAPVVWPWVKSLLPGKSNG